MLGDDLEVEFPRSEDEAREGEFHGLNGDYCFPSRRLAWRALEERSFTARKTVSQQIQQVSKFFNFVL
jgi:hypothetical protein